MSTAPPIVAEEGARPAQQGTTLPGNPSAVAREALRQLASLRLPPTPENYARVYNNIADPGVRPAPGGALAMLRELDVLADKNDATGLQQDQTVSRLEDVDYNAALSHFAQQQTALTAAQKSFLQVTGLSLFQYL